MTPHRDTYDLLLASDPYATHVMARLFDYFADTTPWPRRLWDVSSVLALREAWEAGDWQRRHVLSAGAVGWNLHNLERELGPDRGLGDSRLRKELIGLLRSGLAPDSEQRRRLLQLMPLISAGYVRRWADSVKAGNLPSPERLSWAIASHLLDNGWSLGHLHRWVRDLAAEPGATLGALLDGAACLEDAGEVEYEVLLPFVALPEWQRLADRLPEWRSAPRAAHWFRRNGVQRPPRHNGAFLYKISAKDPIGAARRAGALVVRLEARSRYSRARRGRVVPVGQIWVAGHPEALPVQPPARGADVLSLSREGTMYQVTGSERLDDALELAAPINEGPMAPAVTGAWAALESLLYEPADKEDTEKGRAIAADRLAALVACSWPRAELTALAHRHRPATIDELWIELEGTRSNARRAGIIARAVADGGGPANVAAGDYAAVERMRRVLRAPHSELQEVRRIVAGVFRRLYRQRNIVVHGGTTAAVALEATLRGAAPLLGAGLDRLVHAKLTLNIEPLDLAARAENSLALVGDPLGPAVTSLLE